MNKYMIALVFFTSLLFACKEDVKTSSDKKEVSTTGQVKSYTKTSTYQEPSEKRVLSAELVIPEEVTKAKEARIKAEEKAAIKSKRDKLYEKNKKIRAEYKESNKSKESNVSKESGMEDMGNGVKINRNYNFASYDLPSACDLLPKEWLEKNFSISKEDLLIKDSSSPRTKYARSCFFKWDIPDVANGGIMLQLQKNPIPEETDNWVIGFLDSKRKEGESSMNEPDVRMTYKDLPGLGDEAVYNYGLNRCYWRVGDDQLFMLAFNLGMTEQDERNIAVKIGNEVVRNFKKIKK